LTACQDSDGDGVLPEDEVSGCTDEAATNFNPYATENDFTCIYIGSFQCGGLSTITFDGYTYDLVGIGNQCWFKENLRSETYLNGDSIPGNLDVIDWTNTNLGAQTIYGEGSSEVDTCSADEVANLATYGRLYNWYAVHDSRGLCPSGFHVPSDEDWNLLENALGGASVAGSVLKATFPEWNGTNASGFIALPGGFRYDYFSDEGENGYWWTSSISEYGAWARYLNFSFESVGRDIIDTRIGFSVRCVKD
jgi:uncharacterized protein (TIGR02145 family)